MPKKVVYVIVTLLILIGVIWVIGQFQQAASSSAAAKQTIAAELDLQSTSISLTNAAPP